MAARVDESKLRHPFERPIFIGSVLVNVALLVAALLLIGRGSDWLKQHPRLEKRADQLQAAALAALAAPLGLTLLRNRRSAGVRANCLRISPTQFPRVHADFEEMCSALGMRTRPELYVSDREIDELSIAYSVWNADFVVLRTRYFAAKPDELRDVYRFFLGRELGRLRLHHASWLNELLVAYVIRVPVLRNPLLHARTYSHDRYALALAPDSVRGLVVQASGRRLLKRADVDEYLRHSRTALGWWPRLAGLMRTSPFIAHRIAALEKAGLLPRPTDGDAPVAIPPGVAVAPAAEVAPPVILSV